MEQRQTEEQTAASAGSHVTLSIANASVARCTTSNLGSESDGAEALLSAAPIDGDDDGDDDDAYLSDQRPWRRRGIAGAHSFSCSGGRIEV